MLPGGSMKRLIIGSLMALATARSGSAQSAHQQTLFVGGESVSLGSSSTVAGTALWQQRRSPGLFIEFGATTGRERDHGWFHGHGGALVRRDATTIQVGVDAGLAPNGAAAVSYQKWRGIVERSLGQSGAGIGAEGILVRVGHQYVRGAGAGGYFSPTRAATVRLNSYLLNSAGITTTVFTSRVDYAWRRWGVLAGASLSGQHVDVSPTVPGLLWSDRIWFVGGSIHFGSRTVIATYEHTRQAAVEGRAIRWGLVLPLR
jgi:hypothetical protein